jgi:hypothetical protein
MASTLIKTWPDIEGLVAAADKAMSRGKPTFRQRAEILDIISGARAPEGTKDAGWYSDLWDMNLPIGKAWVKAWTDDVQNYPFDPRTPPDKLPEEIISRMRTDAVLSWCCAKWREYGNCWFRLDDALIHALLATEAKGLRPDDVRVPFPALYVEFPKGILSLYHDITGWHEVRSLYIAEGFFTKAEFPHLFGRRLLVVSDTEPNEKSTDALDNNFVYWTIPLNDPDKSVETLCDELDKSHDHMAGAAYIPYIDRRTGKVLGTTTSLREAMQLVQRFTLNFLLFLTSEQAETRVVTTGGKRRKGRRAHRHGDTKPHKVTLVRSKVPIAKGVREAYRSGRSTDRSITVRTVVRGHYRWQAHGPRHSKRKLKWIAPHIRGKDVATALRGHDYEVNK